MAIRRGMKEMLKRKVVRIFCITSALAGCRATPPEKWETAVITKVEHSITFHGKEVTTRVQTRRPMSRAEKKLSHITMARVMGQEAVGSNPIVPTILLASIVYIARKSEERCDKSTLRLSPQRECRLLKHPRWPSQFHNTRGTTVSACPCALRQRTRNCF
jgi:hypothetical protein